MASANAVDMDAGAMASGKKSARKPKPATIGLGSDEVDGCIAGATCRRPRCGSRSV